MNALQTKPKPMRDPRLIEGVLSGTSLFRGASPAQVAGLARHCWTLQARRGDLVAARDSRLPGVFALAYGTVKLVLHGRAKVERVLRLVSAGQTFGEPSALLARPCRYEARALAESKLVVIPPAAILGLVDGDPRSARALIQALAERNIELLAEVESSSLRDSAQRLASYLSSLAKPPRNGDGVNGSCPVRLPAAKTVIASRLGMTKETLSRLLRSLSEQGLIQVAKREITIVDRERLAGLT